MATADKYSKVFAFILMIFVSLGIAFCLLNIFQEKSSLKDAVANINSHEIVSLEEARFSYEKQLSGELQNMLDKWLGENKSKVSVRAQMDFAQNQQTRELLDMDNPVLVKAQGDNVEYAYSKQTILSSQKSGQIKHLSVAVLVDSQVSKDKITDLERLVESSAGFDKNRGDTLEIIETSFAPTPLFSDVDMMSVLFVLLVVLLFVLFGVIMTKNGMVAQQIEPLPAVLPAFTNPAVVGSVAASSAVEGQVAPNALKKAQSLLQAKPDETLTLLRGWLCQSEGGSYEP